MNEWKSQILKTDGDKYVILVRMAVGLVFLSEGIQKFLFPITRGAGRFEAIGLPNAEFLGSMIGGLEILAGLMIIIGLGTRLASLIIISIMLSALTLTKVPILMEKGLWVALHDSRTDYSMLMGSLFLFFKGGGNYSLDRKFQKT
ncbi:DoxX family protein [Aureibacter tunicatorum]|uniref:Membrane protein YphA (DoxX/SURF4 family) n=1 Tax=Aureibacter tunicatorum TaxID=866807 RepID=A0AAE3XIR1_9BACT|nr:DoxX family protein [Aureibacter tunicatorum]MDR6237170.1 putative membrane protein YphA (DoxX/SURF4 family) [Aureibacter tunicatorum]BDD06162.1 putative membrane protein [Aureibacter tunicatorum]